MKSLLVIGAVVLGGALVAVTHPFESQCDRFDRLCTEWASSPTQLVKAMSCGFLAIQVAANRNDAVCQKAIEAIEGN